MSAIVEKLPAGSLLFFFFFFRLWKLSNNPNFSSKYLTIYRVSLLFYFTKQILQLFLRVPLLNWLYPSNQKSTSKRARNNGATIPQLCCNLFVETTSPLLPPCFDAYNFDFDSSRSFLELSQVFYLVRS